MALYAFNIRITYCNYGKNNITDCYHIKMCLIKAHNRLICLYGRHRIERAFICIFIFDMLKKNVFETIAGFNPIGKYHVTAVPRVFCPNFTRFAFRNKKERKCEVLYSYWTVN